MRAQSRVPLKEILCEIEATKTIKHISKNNTGLPKISDYTCRAHVLRDVKHSVNVHVNRRGENLTFILNTVLFCYF